MTIQADNTATAVAARPTRLGACGAERRRDGRVRPALGVLAACVAAAGLLLPPAAGAESRVGAGGRGASGATAPGAARGAAAPGAAELPAAATGKTDVYNGLVAVVDGDPLTLHDLRSYRSTAAVFLPPELRDNFQALLQDMIERRMLHSEFEKNGIKVSDEMVNQYINGVLRQNGQTRAQVEKAVAEAGLQWSDYFERMREEVQRISLVNLLIRAHVNVTPEEVERAWKNDPQFLQPERLDIADIFLPLPADPQAAAAVRAEAQEVVRQARRNFADAARKYSKGPAADEGGRLGDFRRGSMAPYFERATATLKVGEVAEPVEGGGGVHIVKLLEILPAGRRPLDEVSEQIRDRLYEQRLDERYQKWVSEDLRKEHRVEILLDELALAAAS